MTVFNRRLGSGIVNAVFTEIDRTSPLGTIKGESYNIRCIVDEGGSENWQSTQAEHNSSVLIYCYPEAPIYRDCVGGHIKIENGRNFRIDGWDVGKNQRLGIVEHIELTCSEQI
jgi:hypothetical protein